MRRSTMTRLIAVSTCSGPSDALMAKSSYEIVGKGTGYSHLGHLKQYNFFGSLNQSYLKLDVFFFSFHVIVSDSRTRGQFFLKKD